MPPPDPLAGMYADAPKASKHTFPIAGIAVDVFGLDELPAAATQVCVLWLLHPRQSKKQRMEPVAHASIAAWNARLRERPTRAPLGLIAAAFDQRNHGTRLLDKRSNEAWTGGNPRHAQDMFSIFQGTALDLSQLIDFLPAHAFPDARRTPTRHLVLGVSLGAHAGWHAVLRDPRVTGAVIVVGCADYTRLMRLRAATSGLESWTRSSPPGAAFAGSPDFPPALERMVAEWDPAALLMGRLRGDERPRAPTDAEAAALLPLMRERLRGKRILNMAGGDDELVPHSCSVPFVGWLSRAVAPGGWFDGNDCSIVDKVFPGVGHQFSADMQRDALAFILEEASLPGTPASKM